MLSSAQLIDTHRELNKSSGRKSHDATAACKQRKLRVRDEIARRANAGCAECADYLQQRGDGAPCTISAAEMQPIDTPEAAGARAQLNAAATGGRSISEEHRSRLEKLAYSSGSRPGGQVLDFDRRHEAGFEPAADAAGRVVDKVAAARG